MNNAFTIAYKTKDNVKKRAEISQRTKIKVTTLMKSTGKTNEYVGYPVSVDRASDMIIMKSKKEDVQSYQLLIPTIIRIEILETEHLEKDN